MSEYRFEKIQVPAELSLTQGPPVSGSFFVAGSAFDHDGPERVSDLLNGPMGFLHDTDFAYEIPGLARFRSNVFMDRRGRGAVFRVIPSKIMTAGDLGLSPAILKLCSLHKGLRPGHRSDGLG